MQIDPINAYASRAAAHAARELREYYNQVAARRLAMANILRELGEAVRQLESTRAENAELFERFRRRLIPR